MTSTIKADVIEAATGTNTSLELRGKGSGVVNLSAGSTIGGAALPTLSALSDLQIGLMLNTFDDLVDHGRTLVSSPVVIADEFEDALGIDTGNSTGETYNAAGYVSNPQSSLISQATGANLGDGSRTADAFDGNEVQSRTTGSGAEASSNNAILNLGKDYSAVGGKTISGWRAVGGSVNGFIESSDAGFTCKLYGSNVGFKDGGATLLETYNAPADSAGLVIDRSSTGSYGPYDYVWVEFPASGSGTATTECAELQFYEVSTSALDVRSVGVTMASGPTSGFVVSKFSGADPTAVYASNDGGTTWDAVTLTDYGDYGSGISVFAGPVTLTGGGTDVRLRATRASGTECKVEAWSGVFG